MNINKDPLATPVYLKGEGFQWPEDKMFYLITQDGLYLCRNHPFFRSSVKMKEGPKFLKPHSRLMELGYPTLPQVLVERVVGFFRLVAEKQNSESVAIWVWNKTSEQVELLIPDQIGVNSSTASGSPHGYPMDVKYEIPVLPPHLMMIGDIHCHVDMSAYSSYTDQDDEMHRPGIHIIVGHIDQKVPQFHCEAVVDGERFKVDDLDLVWEGFDKIDTASVPPEWMDKVKLEIKKYSGFGWSYSGLGSYKPVPPDESDKKIIKSIINRYKDKGKVPLLYDLRQSLFHGTKTASYKYCELKAQSVIDNWHNPEKIHEEPTTEEQAAQTETAIQLSH